MRLGWVRREGRERGREEREGGREGEREREVEKEGGERGGNLCVIESPHNDIHGPNLVQEVNPQVLGSLDSL